MSLKVVSIEKLGYNMRKLKGCKHRKVRIYQWAEKL